MESSFFCICAQSRQGDKMKRTLMLKSSRPACEYQNVSEKWRRMCRWSYYSEQSDRMELLTSHRGKQMWEVQLSIYFPHLHVWSSTGTKLVDIKERTSPMFNQLCIIPMWVVYANEQCLPFLHVWPCVWYRQIGVTVLSCSPQWPAGADTIARKKTSDCMVADEKITRLLPWFIHSVNIFPMSWWSQGWGLQSSVTWWPCIRTVSNGH